MQAQNSELKPIKHTEDGSIDYVYYQRRARELRADAVVEWLSCLWCKLRAIWQARPMKPVSSGKIKAHLPKPKQNIGL